MNDRILLVLAVESLVATGLVLLAAGMQFSLPYSSFLLGMLALAMFNLNVFAPALYFSTRSK